MSSRRLRVVAIAAVALVPAAGRAAAESCGDVNDEVRRVTARGVVVLSFAPDGEGVQPYDISPDGKRVLFSGEVGGNSGLWTAALDGSSLRRLGHGSNGRFSPDGRSVAYVDYTSALCPAILVVSSAGGRARRVARCADNPTWSPDSTRIAFVDERGGPSARRHLAVVGARGGRVRALTPWIWPGLPMDRPAWAPDGSRLAYDAGDPVRASTRPHAYAIRADGTRRTFLGFGIDPAWAPDGSAIVLTRPVRTRGGSAHWALSTVTPAGRFLREVGPYARLPAWAAWRGIAYVGLSRGVEQVFLVAPGSPPRQLTADRVDIDSEITALLWRGNGSLLYLRQRCS